MPALTPFTQYPDSPFRVPFGGGDPRLSDFDLARLPTDAGEADVKKSEAKKETKAILDEVQSLQEALYAEGRRSLLVVLQAIDAGGKDSTIRRVFGHLNPQGVRVWSFKQPSALERSHDFLWRHHDKAPAAGMIGVFNRSHYEAVLVERVKEIVPEAVWRRRYDQINAFERLLASEGTAVVKFFLHLSPDEQADRFRDRLVQPEKWWKFSEHDLTERRRWHDYSAAFRDALAACSTAHAPWYAIPADQKWYRDLLIAGIVRDSLKAMDLAYPEPAADMKRQVDDFLAALDEPLPEPGGTLARAG
jgi:PPK2 family polyphosphate:nucleotide phosphotransferase